MSNTAILGTVAPFIPAGNDLDKAVAFYEQNLGFTKIRQVGRFATVRRDNTTLILSQEDNEALAKGTLMRINVEQIEALYQEYQALSELEMQPWGKRAFPCR